MSLIRKHRAVLQAWACLARVLPEIGVKCFISQIERCSGCKIHR